MRYIGYSINSVLGPKLLGTYEKELQPALEAACAGDYRLIIDVGAAEGYYAVGMALRNPQARVVAFETDPNAQLLLRQMVALNSLAGRVEIRGHCDLSELTRTIDERAYLIMDVEGAEQELLVPERCNALRHTEILVELHDFVVPGIRDLLVERFERSHSITEIRERDRGPEDLPLAFRLVHWLMPRRVIDHALGEFRPAKMSWLHMRPRNSDTR